ncbi:X-ray repair cross-complementing protein 5 isoform X1 [Petromyzon marinus]|uniref:X-ray repair cross-complementing protein 5 n=1 Tax=Petromyzon marinus TaxID=7757 RepID=A0AAJ7TLK4_PETMA|nr:X-ray repair cross-complementing protein 5 isoform X1 [Petromyzon marinus]
MARSAMAVCMDVGLSMGSQVPGQGTSMDLAKEVFTKFTQRQVFADSKDEVALVLFGTEETQNDLAEDGGYQNINAIRSLRVADFELLEYIQTLESSSCQGDYVDAIVVCMDLLQKKVVGKRFERLSICVLSDLGGPCSADQVDIIRKNLKKADIALQFFLPFPLSEEGDMDRGDDGRNEGQSPRYSGPGGKGLTAVQHKGVKVLKDLLLGPEGEPELDEVYTFSNGLERLSFFKRMERQPYPWPCTMTLGANLTIRITGYKAVTLETPKKAWTTVEAQSKRKEDIKQETVYCLFDENEKEIGEDDLIQGYRYGSDIIPFSKEDESQMKYKLDGKCFDVLGFTKSCHIKRHHYMGTQTIKITGNGDDEHSVVAFSALLHALEELDMVAIVRYAYNVASIPQVGFGFPNIKSTHEYMVFLQLPYCEDLRHYTFPPLINNKMFTPSEEQLSAVDSLIDRMSLVREDEGGVVEELFKTTKIPNPVFQRLFQCLQHKAFFPEEPLPPMEQNLLAMLEPPPEITAASAPVLELLQKLFPLQAAPKKEQLTGKEIFKDSRNREEPEEKKPRFSDDGDENGSACLVASVAEGRVSKVGTVDPRKDFQVLCARKEEFSFKEVSEQLERCLEKFLDLRERTYYMKTLDCLKAYREEANKAKEPHQYNTFLKRLKQLVADLGLQDFWQLLVQDRLTLISCEENSASSVTGQEAEQFFVVEQVQEELMVAEPAADVDDLLEMM